MDAALDLLQSLPGGRLDVEASAIRNSEEGQMMRTSLFVGILCISAAIFALPASAQNGRQSTPATNGMCDGYGDATPGLQGLCIAMCEAQACEAEIDRYGNVTFGASCGPSSPQLLENYWKIVETRGNENDPANPACVQKACDCWTETSLNAIGDGQSFCSSNDTYMSSIEVNSTTGNWDTASFSRTWRECTYSANGEYSRERNLSDVQIQKCAKSMKRVCDAK